MLINIFACTCPNRSGVGAIDNPDRFEQVFYPYYILEVPEKNFTHDISMVRRQKMLIFGVLKAFHAGRSNSKLGNGVRDREWCMQML